MFAVRSAGGRDEGEKWSTRAEAYLLECSGRTPPYGMNKHFHLLSMALGLQKYCGYEFTVADVVEKLSTFYNLQYHDEVRPPPPSSCFYPQLYSRSLIECFSHLTAISTASLPAHRFDLRQAPPPAFLPDNCLQNPQHVRILVPWH